MAEYVKKENIIDIIDNSSDLQEVKSCMMYGLETADVVEREYYDFIVKNRDYYKDKYEHFLQLYDTYRHKNITLKNKIDKAIEELQHIKVYERTATARLVSLPEVLDVLKRNIGE